MAPQEALTRAESWPLMAKEILISGDTRSRKIEPFGEDAQIISLIGLDSLAELPPFPLTLIKLTIVDCPNLISVPPLPLGLQQLVIYDCPSLEWTPDSFRDFLPSSLCQLECDIGPHVPKLPAGLLKCSLMGYTAPRAIELPSKLQYFRSVRMQIEHMAFPTSLKTFESLEYSGKTLLGLPSSIKNLTVVDAENLVELSLPSKLETLTIQGCAALRMLPYRKSLKSLQLDHPVFVKGSLVSTLEEYHKARLSFLSWI